MYTLVGAIVTILLVFLAFTVFYKRSTTAPELRAIPEPPGALPYIGHILSLGVFVQLKLPEWKQTLGDIFMVRMGQVNVLVLSSDEVVQELIVNRGQIYSGRPPTTLLHEIVMRGLGLFFCPYNAHFKLARSIATKALTRSKLMSYSPTFLRAARQFVAVLLDAHNNRAGSVNARQCCRFFPTSIIMEVIANVHFTGVDDERFLRYIGFVQAFFELSDVKYAAVDYFPILKYLPSSDIKRKAVQLRDDFESFIGELLEDVKRDPEKSPCVMRDCLDEGYPDLHIIHILNSLLIGGSETLPASLYWFIALMACHASVQDRIHEEMNRVVGCNRLPTLDDEVNLPYLRATIREAQRFRPVTAVGTPHFIEQDDEYKGYHIPKNSTVIINLWSLNFDEQKYHEPKRFNPERFLGIDASSATLVNGPCEKRDHYGFGAGRRYCVGVQMAEAELFVFTAYLLWAFRIEPPRPDDPNKNPAPALDSFKPGMTVWPEDFGVHFVPRHEKVQDLCTD